MTRRFRKRPEQSIFKIKFEKTECIRIVQKRRDIFCVNFRRFPRQTA